MAFSSSSDNLVSDDTNGTQDIFVRDRVLQTTERVSVNSDWQQANGFSFSPNISRDGKLVVFVSGATNLAAGDTNGAYDLFIRDRDLKTTQRVSVDRYGNQLDYSSEKPEISADNRFVVFQSAATNLVQNDTNGRIDVFIKDLLTNSVNRVSVDQSGKVQGDNFSFEPTISADNRFVAFTTYATNLTSDMTINSDIVLRAAPTVRIDSITPDLIPINATTQVSISGEGFVHNCEPFISGDGMSISNIQVVSESLITMDVTILQDAQPGPRHLNLATWGTGPGPLSGILTSCLNCLAFF